MTGSNVWTALALLCTLASTPTKADSPNAADDSDTCSSLFRKTYREFCPAAASQGELIMSMITSTGKGSFTRDELGEALTNLGSPDEQLSKTCLAIFPTSPFSRLLLFMQKKIASDKKAID